MRAMDQLREMARALTNVWAWVLSALMCAAGCFLLVLSGWDWVKSEAQWAAFLSQLGGLLLATGLVTFAWELVGRRQFSRELFAMANLSTDLRESGLERVGNWMELDEPSLWTDLFRDAKEIDVLMVYSTQVIGAQRHLLIDAQKGGAKVRIFLPDPEDGVTMASLAYRFNSDPNTLRTKVHEAMEQFQDIRAKSGVDRLKVHLRKGPLTYACYRFDSRVVFTLYSQSRDRQPYVPTFMVKGGHLFDFFKGDLEALAAAKDGATGGSELTDATDAQR